jgi:hypothetical protein
LTNHRARVVDGELRRRLETIDTPAVAPRKIDWGHARSSSIRRSAHPRPVIVTADLVAACAASPRAHGAPRPSVGQQLDAPVPAAVVAAR